MPEENGLKTETTPVTEPKPMPAKLFAALATAQKSFGVPVKSKTAKIKGETRSGSKFEYEYKYATLDDVIAATRPHLNENGIAVIQNTGVAGARVTVRTILAHSSGESWTSDPMEMTGDSGDPKKTGSAISYARRYQMSATLGVASEEDDDADGAQLARQEKAKAGSGNNRTVNRPDDADQRSDEERARDAGNRKEPAKSKPDVMENELPKGNVDPDKKIGKGDTAHYEGCINAKQVKRLFSVAQQHNVSNEQLRAFLADGKIPASDRIPVDRYDAIISAIQNGHVNAD